MGVLKVLEREKIPIDYIAGSSIGAVVAAFYAIGTSIPEMERIASKMRLWRSFYLADVSIFPWRGLIKGKRILRFLKKYLKDTTFEETKVPLLMVGTNIHERRSRVMNSGSIVQALRASIAIPGIFQSVRYGQELIIDGGVLDPLPIRPLLDAGVDKIIAVDVLPTPGEIQERKRYQERLQMAEKVLLARKNKAFQAMVRLRKWVSKAFLPNFIDTVINSMQAMEHEIVDTLATDADVLIRPSTPHISWVEFNRSKELIQKGEESAEAMVDQLHALVKQQSV